MSLVALAALPFAACFAEPQAVLTPSPVWGSAAGAPSLGGSAGRVSARGGSGDANRAGEPDEGFGGAGAEDPGPGGVPGAGGEPEPVTLSCNDATGEPLPARQAITSNDAPPPSTGGVEVLTLTRSSLFTEFQRQTCGNSGCHGGKGDALADPPDPFQVTLDTFDRRPTLGEDALTRILSSDPDLVMPPGSGDGSKRSKDDPVRRLGERLLAWEQQGFPDSFTITLDSGTSRELPSNPYLLSPTLGKKLTNIGSCIPSSAVMLNPIAEEMQQKDALFASLETSADLPDTIFETDLVSLDSAELSRRGIFSYAPTYPLYSDHAGKMRYLRVPRGTSIRYDESLHDFVIPDNTRFYKTFLKEVRDRDGKVGYRKMETRLIVVRQDEQLADGSYKLHALRASYAWDRNETMAYRVKDPFRNGQPAADRLCAYVVDEAVTRDPALNPISDQVSETCDYMTPDEMSDPKSGQIRHYAIPSTDRCDQCHMGSSNHSFILGFTPWQVDRRRSGEGGIYEEPADDELGQLKRLLDYGVVTGIEPGQAKLEESQLIAEPPRSPRNDYELEAQGYMLGNCAFCHNPHGFPVVTNPVLKEFELFPSKTGGVFQFPLDKFSPRAKGGVTQSVRIPYITADFGDVNLSGGSVATVEKTAYLPPQDGVYPVTDATSPDVPDYDPSHGTFTLLGPWRSLIWRNTYTPFTYSEDSTLYIHMPRNAAGFDCRASRIMANWMLSIPTVPNTGTDAREQPVTEVSSTDPHAAFAYGQGVRAAKDRLDRYARSVTGAWCPPDDDIIDPKVAGSPIDTSTGRHTLSSPQDYGMPPNARVDPTYVLPGGLGDAVPDHAHWIPTDTTELPGKWIPRRSNWRNYLIERDVPVSDDLKAVIDDLQSVHLSPELENFALEPLPMGLWHPECAKDAAVSATPTVSELRDDTAAALHRWLKGGVVERDHPQSDDDHVHLQSRGEAVFHAICQNCHGQKVDSRSPLAATILELTGGQTRVANFVNGLFGPPSAPGAYARDEFLVDDGASPDDWQARYVLFMGLGGTGASIPVSVLNLVATSPFYGFGIVAPGASTPNMLGSAQQFCFYALESARFLERTVPTISKFELTWVPNTGHYELWESLCATGNDPVVHVFDPLQTLPSYNFDQTYRAKDDAGAWVYPPDALVGNQRGEIELGIDSSNLMPWCVRASTDEERAHALAWAEDAGLTADTAPFCPESLFASAFDLPVYKLALDQIRRTADTTVSMGNQDFTTHWLRHGAMNAGLAAFHFMRAFTNGSVQPNQPFDFCRQ